MLGWGGSVGHPPYGVGGDGALAQGPPLLGAGAKGSLASSCPSGAPRRPRGSGSCGSV